MTNELIDRNFIETRLLARDGGLNPRALKKYGISKEVVYQIYNGLSGPKQCQECAKPTTFLSFKKGYTAFCSSVCVGKNSQIAAKKKSTLVNNFGIEGFKSEIIQNKKKSTSLNNYGVEHARQSKKYMDSLRLKFLDEYGISNPACVKSANEKRTKTNLEKYGYSNPASSSSVRTKIEETNIKRYGVKSALMLEENRLTGLEKRRENDLYLYLNNPEWLEANKSIPSTILSEKFGIAFSTILNYYKKHNVVRPNIIVSSHEILIANFLEENNIKFTTHDRTILNGKEIDIYLPEYRIGIEIHGLYWHSENFISDHYYHAKKRTLALEKNIQLLQITDYEIDNKLSIVKNRILSKINKHDSIYGRKCRVIDIDSKSYDDFMNSNHIQGTAAASVRLGLEYKNEIVAIMSFSKSRYNKKYEWELIRYASKDTVVGGASKLFCYFIKNIQPTSIISYADLRWNSGEMYTKIGMTLSHTTKPNYWYIIDGRLTHRSAFQKHKLKKILYLFDENLSEWENMKNNSYTRFWDCGNNVYIWDKQ